jgi:hypothetical protein
MSEQFTDDWVLQERAARMRASGRWSVPEIARELRCSIRSVYRMLPKYLRLGEVWAYARTDAERDTFRKWHDEMKAAGLPRNGSVTIRGGKTVKTGRREAWW